MSRKIRPVLCLDRFRCFSALNAAGGDFVQSSPLETDKNRIGIVMSGCGCAIELATDEPAVETRENDYGRKGPT